MRWNGLFAAAGVLAALFIVTVASATATPPAATDFRVNTGVRQLFLDDFGIENRAGLKRVLNAAVKHPKNPVMQRERPWEQMRVQLYGTAMFDPDKKLFRMWYQVIPRPSQDPPVRIADRLRVPNTTLIAYATSEDGVKWQKPNLGQLAFEGDSGTNLLDVGRDNSEGPAVLFDANEPNPDRRYKMLFWEHTFHAKDWVAYVKSGYQGRHPRYIYEEQGDGMWLAYSADGVRWKNHGRVANYQSDSGQNLIWDPVNKKYLAYGRYNVGRRVARMESSDGLNWSPAKLVLECDKQDGPKAQVYGIGVTRYEDLYLGMLWIYHEGTSHGIDVQLVHSRDGIQWERTAERQVLLSNGPPGAWDAGDIRTATQPVIAGDQIYIYYSASSGPHDVPLAERNNREYALKNRSMHIGLATLRRDGWVSLDAMRDGGTLLTKPFALPAGDLHLNTDAAGGEVLATLIGSTGDVLAESSAVTVDGPRQRVAWKTTPPPAGTRVRLKLTARDARLFSYWFETSKP